MWSWQGPHSVRIFYLAGVTCRLKTKEELLRRHVSNSCACDRCSAPIEDIVHVLRDCMAAKGSWNLVILVAHKQDFYKLSLRD